MFAKKHQIRVMSAILAATLSMSPSVQAVAGTSVSSNSEYRSGYEETEAGDISEETEEATEETTESSESEESSEVSEENSESTEGSESSESDDEESDHEDTASENEAAEDEIPSEEVSDNAADEQNEERASLTEADDAMSIMSVSSESSNSVSYNAYSGVETVPSRLNDGTLGMVRGQKWYTSTDGLETGNKKLVKISTKKGIVQASKPGTVEVGVGGRKYHVTVVDPALSTKKVSIGVGDSSSVELKDKKSKENLANLGFKIAWETTNANVAQVVNGTIVGTGKGSAKVYAVVGGKIYSVNVKVKDKPSSEYLMNMPNKKSARNQVPQAAKTTWSFDGEKISISDKSKAKVTAKEQGLTIVKGNDNHKVWVYSNNPTVDTSYGISAVGKSNKYTVRMIPGDKLFINLSESHELPIWKTNKPGIAVASEFGCIIAESKGTANLTARVGGKKVNVQVVVGDTRSYDYSTMDDSYFEKTIIDPMNGNTTVNLYIKRDGTYIIGDVSPKEYSTVKFDSNGGSHVADARVKKGSAVSRPSDPTKAKNVFNGWNYAGFKWDFEQAVADNMTLTASWLADENENGIPDTVENEDPSQKIFTVIYDANGGKLGNGSEFGIMETTESMLRADLVIPVRDGFEFKGWHYQDNKKAWKPNDVITGNTTLVAYWEKDGVLYGNNLPLVMFNDAHGGFFMRRANEDHTVTAPVPEWTDHAFQGWFYEDGTTEYVETDVFTETKILTAKWDGGKEGTYKDLVVTFNPENGDEPTVVTVKTGSKVKEIEEPWKNRFAFVGWYNGNVRYDFSDAVTRNITLTAKWVPATYMTVSFNSNGGTEVAPITVQSGNRIAKPGDPIRESDFNGEYEFRGWTLDGETFDFDTKIYKNFTLNAEWKKVFTVSFNSNTDDGIKFKSQRIDEGDHVTEPDSRKMKGHTYTKTFKQWENEDKFDFNEGVDDSFTLEGQWTKAFTMYKDGYEGNKILKALVDAEKGTYSQVKHYISYNGIPEFLLSYDEDKLVNGIGTFDGVMVGVLSVPFGTNTPATDKNVDTDVNTELFVWYNHAEHSFYWWSEAVGEKNGIWPGTNMDHLFDDYTGIAPDDLPFWNDDLYSYHLTYAPVSDSFAGSVEKNNYPFTDMTIAINNSDGTISKNVINPAYGTTSEIKLPKSAKAVTLSLVLKEAKDRYYTYKWHVVDENGTEVQTGGGQSILLNTLGNYTVYFTAEPMPAFFG